MESAAWIEGPPMEEGYYWIRTEDHGGYPHVALVQVRFLPDNHLEVANLRGRQCLDAIKGRPWIPFVVQSIGLADRQAFKAVDLQDFRSIHHIRLVEPHTGLNPEKT